MDSFRAATLGLLLVCGVHSASAMGQQGDIGILDKATADQAWTTRETYSPYADQPYPTRVFWGDTHLHTSLSQVSAQNPDSQTLIVSRVARKFVHPPGRGFVSADHLTFSWLQTTPKGWELWVNCSKATRNSWPTPR